ncbi:PAS domain-containing protein [Deinococcus sp. 14RED07]|uniref:sensor histidine kinase n=1 Tax=unclassified Deinococcus TaxID=2623546 RepID=UPI001E4A9E4C|nr:MULTISPECIES: ATP-binding protein [unclassified Deinococcus]MCD0156611.1 PAS domain-containing protein [Deinococcus sp. 6GRE01]MCD0176574.1 PAS domain-containing protein [Deinococcus sp. 14RED07]
MPGHGTLPSRYAIAAFDALSAHVAILDSTGTVAAVNRAWANFARENGGSSGLGSNYLDICASANGPDQDDALTIMAGIQDVLRADADVFEMEYPCHSPTEQRYFVARVTRFEQDGQTYVMVAHENITRRKLAELEVRLLNQTLEAKVQRRTQELEASRRALSRQNRELEARNDELSQFASIASHDLQEPLRTLSLHADMLQVRYRGRQLDERADRSLGYIVGQAARARRLVQDILIMADITAAPVTVQLDLKTLLPDILETLRWPADQPLRCENLPPVQANPGQLRQLLTNLLGNALKFSAGRELDVTLSGTQEGDQVTFEVSDAGVGIAEEHAEQVFEMFRRLQNRTESGGNGIGLAVCRKVVERHGGRIWITGNDRGGTSVHFTLPAWTPDAESPPNSP